MFIDLLQSDKKVCRIETHLDENDTNTMHKAHEIALALRMSRKKFANGCAHVRAFICKGLKLILIETHTSNDKCGI